MVREKLSKFIFDDYNCTEEEYNKYSPWDFQYYWRGKLNQRSIEEEENYQRDNYFEIKYGIELDDVEFSMKIEKLFDVWIKDEEAERLKSFDELINLIELRLKEKNEIN